MATPMPATLAEFKKYLQKSASVTTDDGELTSMLEAATEAAEGWAPKGCSAVGPIVAREFTDSVNISGGFALFPKSPIQSVTSMTRASDGLAYVTADLDVDPGTGIVTAVSGRLQSGRYVAVYEAGRDPVPVALKEATLVIGKHLWESQRGPGRRTGRGEDSESRAQWTGYGYLIPNRAAHLLQPFTSVAVA